MAKPTLYLFIGYPGAGKTTVAKIIAEMTGAVHLWSDHERHKLFGQPTHTQTESVALYNSLNRRTGELLATGHSVIFDTNFNFYADRKKLRDIASRNAAETVVIWIIVSKQLAKDRAVCVDYSRNGYATQMTEQQFNSIVSKLEPPKKDEKVIKIDGTQLDRQEVMRLLSQ